MPLTCSAVKSPARGWWHRLTVILAFAVFLPGLTRAQMPAPASLTAISGPALANLQWSASPGAASYNVLRSAGSGGPYTLDRVTTMHGLVTASNAFGAVSSGDFTTNSITPANQLTYNVRIGTNSLSR